MFADFPQENAATIPNVTPRDLLQRTLENCVRDGVADLLAIYTYSADLNQALLVASTPGEPDPNVRGHVEKFCKSDSPSLSPDKAALASVGYKSGLLLPITLDKERIGAFVLLGRTAKKTFDLQDAQLQYCFTMIQSLLQNHYRTENEATSFTIQRIARLIGQNITSQELVNIISESLLKPQIRFCALLAYGPRREDRPNGPFGYLELQGVYSNRFGAGVGSGMHVYLDQYAEMMAELEERGIWHIPDVRAIETRFDPLIRGFIRSSGIQSILMIVLKSGEQRLGVMIVGTEVEREFTPQEIRSYQAVSEFLAMNALAQDLQQQHDFVQRARAALLDSVNDGVMMVLPNAGTVIGDNSKTYVLTVNKAFTAMFSISQLRAQGLSLIQLLNRIQLPEDVRQELSRQWFSLSVRDPSIQRGDFTMIHPEGYHAAIGWYSAPVYQMNRVMGRIYIFHDVTDDRTAISLRANFVSRMSHELRTPLTSIKGFAQYMLEELTSDLTPAVRDYVEIIKDNAQLLNGLFSDIIEITRADLGDLKLNIHSARLVDVIENAMLPFEAQANEERKWLELEFAPALPHVQMDTNWITRVFGQLLANAFQHAPTDSAVRIHARSVIAATDLPLGAPLDVVVPCVLITVEDGGDGVAADDVEMIFQPFFRTRESRAARLEGSGLGLALTRSIIQMHRGKIWAEPRKRGRKGAKFHFTLPTAVD